jgi:PAS domain S-box-containing protein
VKSSRPDARTVHHPTELAEVRAALRSVVAELDIAKAELVRQLSFADAMLDTINVGIVTCDAAGGSITTNRAARIRAGVGDNPRIVSQEAAPGVVDTLDMQGKRLAPQDYPLIRALRGEDVGTVELLLGPVGGPYREHLTHSAQIVGPSGVVLGAVSAVADISVERAATRGLIEAQRIGQLGSFSYDRNHDAFTCSEQLLRNWGLPPNADLALASSEMIHDEDRELVVENWNRALTEGGHARFEHRIVRPDGEVRFLRTDIEIKPDTGGQATIVRGTQLDITDLKLAESKEAEAAEGLRELNRIKDDLVATVSHELRTPLTSILGYVELLNDEDAGTLTAQQRKWAESINRNGDRLLALVDNLLAASTIDAGKLPSGSSPVDLRDVIASARRALQPSIDARRLTTRFHLPAFPVIVQGDAGQLEQVVGNLISNALKFTDDGGTVECTLANEGSQAKLTVSDNGIGIPENEQRGLFTRFFRATTATNRAIQGTGLGLSIASSIVRSHGGAISVISAPGRGTQVMVDIPMAGPRAGRPLTAVA